VQSRRAINAGYGQLRWVVLLLAIAVVLPTVCLLWFMTEVISNERLAARQKLFNVYQGQLAGIVRKIDAKWAQRCGLLDNEDTTVHPYEKLALIAGRDGCDGFIAYDATGKRTYPLLSTDTKSRIEVSEIFRDAWELEFTQQRLAEAAELYGQRAKFYSGYARLAALIGRSRCLAKLGKVDDAIEQCKQVAFSPLAETADQEVLVLIANARLLLTKFTGGKEAHAELFEETFRKLASTVYAVNRAGVALPADHNLFMAQKVLEIGQQVSLVRLGIQPLYGRLKELVTAEERSIHLAEYYPTTESLRNWQMDKFRSLPVGDEELYGLYHQTTNGSLLLLLSKANIASALRESVTGIDDPYVVHRIIDEADGLIGGSEQPQGEPFTTASIGEYLPGWRIELYFKGGDVFEKAANEQIAVYVWTGILVIGLILLAGAFAGKAVSKQIKLNSLKNDLIATVSHELKTPLASMRVLVDTLLEGHYGDQRQATEYLQLISKENERLSRLIDNFLTFSRMERNKQTFHMEKTSPVTIAHDAAEAVRTKFSGGQCEFEVQTGENLPDIVADHDALVTVLVNLLDNAYKYSQQDKHIQLQVFAENSSVCFRVSDTGVGMSRRSVRKVFRRFYQADRSLSRGVRGCGLGLSIAKFIVDAHKGAITVSSKPGQGSTFVVRLPAG